jgi:hypothetical protein
MHFLPPAHSVSTPTGFSYSFRLGGPFRLLKWLPIFPRMSTGPDSVLRPCPCLQSLLQITGGEEVKGLTLWAESAVAADTTSVKEMRAPPVQGVQKPPRRVGEKQFLDSLLAAPELKVKKPAGLKTRPAW